MFFNHYCCVCHFEICPLSDFHLCFRYRSGGGKSQNQNELTVEELRSFVRQLDSLPCTIRQAPLLKVSPLRLDLILCISVFVYKISKILIGTKNSHYNTFDVCE